MTTPLGQEDIYRSIVRIHAYGKTYEAHRPPKSSVNDGHGTGTGFFVKRLTPKPFYYDDDEESSSSDRFYFEGSMRHRARTMPRDGSVAADANGYYVLTCAHVIEGAYSVKVKVMHGNVAAQEIPATVVSYVPYDLFAFERDYHPKYDLALLHIARPAEWDSAGFEPNYLELGDARTMQVNEDLWAFGFPLATKSLSTNQGHFSSFQHLIHHDVSIAPGNSGGPILNSRGQVVGVNNSGVTRPGAGNINYAVPIEMFTQYCGQFMFSVPTAEPGDPQQHAPWRVLHLPTFGLDLQTTMADGARVSRIHYMEFDAVVLSVDGEAKTADVSLRHLGHGFRVCEATDYKKPRPQCRVSGVSWSQLVPCAADNDDETTDQSLSSVPKQDQAVRVRFRGLDHTDIDDLDGLRVGDIITHVENIDRDLAAAAAQPEYLEVDHNAEVKVSWCPQRMSLMRCMQRFVDPHRQYTFKIRRGGTERIVRLTPRHHRLNGERLLHPPYDDLPYVTCMGLMFVPMSQNLLRSNVDPLVHTFLATNGPSKRMPRLLLSFMVPNLPAKERQILAVGDELTHLNHRVVRTPRQFVDALPFPTGEQRNRIHFRFRSGRVYEVALADLIAYEESSDCIYPMPPAARGILKIYAMNQGMTEHQRDALRPPEKRAELSFVAD